MKNLTLFDLDHTLLPLDSDYAWGEFTTQIGWTDPVEFKQRNDDFFAQYKKGELKIANYVRFATQAIKAQGAAKSQAAHAQFMATVIQPAIQKTTTDLIAKHRAAGDQLIIVTATNEFVTRPIATLLGIDELIAVQLETDSTAGGTGWITGEIKGIASAHEGKVTRVEAWLAAHNLSWNHVHSTFYTDSINDIALLEKVNKPIATNPDPRLRAVAQERGWQVLDLFA
ncbi:MAG TPA: HAD-IB family hydrolase [Burkholderiaceae bacterium]|nr:HAD-IB family hydrolase [Burkholderiaceae bacterium]